ncbi:MAG: cytochrome P450 [Bacteriovoracaceae bacterium]
MNNPCKFITPPKDKFFGLLTGHALKARKRLELYQWLGSFGDYVHFRLGSLNIYLLNDPEAVNHILKKNAKNYTKNTPAYEVVAKVTGKGVFTESEDSWLSIRKIAQPFFTNKQVGHWESIVEKVCLDLEENLKLIERKGELFNFSPLMTRLTLRVLGESIFDKDLGLKAEIFDRELGQLIKVTNDIITLKMSLNFWKKYQNKKKFNHSMAVLDSLIGDLVNEAKSEKLDNPNNMIHAFLKAPFKVDQQYLIDQVKTMAFAGHETTSTVLSWGLHFISVYPEWQEKIYLELKQNFHDGKLSGKNIYQCHELEMYINECIRMYPPAWAFSRRAISDDFINGYKIKAGSIVTVSPYLLGHDVRYWIRPDEFNPYRFSDENHIQRRHAYSFIPFGLGPRACIGEKLSRLEMMMILATFIKDYRILPSGDKVEMEPSLTLSVKNGIKLKLVKRI